LGTDRRDVAGGIEIGMPHMRGLVAYPALQRLLLQELPQQDGIEVMAMPDVERKVFRRFRGKILPRQSRRNEESIRMCAHVGAVDPGIGVMDELSHREVVEHGRKRMKVAFEARFGRPAIEGDAAFVSGMALGHPFRFLNPEAVEKPAQPRCRSFADADDADRGRFDYRDFDAQLLQRARKDQCRHPTRRSAAHHDDAAHRRRQGRCLRHRALSSFMLQGKTITVADGVCSDANGTLAGTALDMASAVRNAVRLLELDIVEAARMASEYPAEFLGLGSELGRIAPGYRANLVQVDDDLKVRRTWIEGLASG